MYKDIPHALLSVLGPVVQEHGLELVDASYSRGGRARLTVIVDTPAGDGRVGVEACARLSREIGHALDALGCIEGAYLLEVTSPGVDRALAREVDFQRAVGRKVAVVTRAPRDGRRRFTGTLLGFEERCARIETDSETVEIAFNEIARAKSFYASEGASGRPGSRPRAARRGLRAANSHGEG
jgi:ribosome maturation factor RimP